MVIDLATYLRQKRDALMAVENWEGAQKYAHRVVIHVSMIAYWGIRRLK